VRAPEREDEPLGRLYEQLRADTLATVRPPGAAAVRAVARERRRRRRQMAVAAAAWVALAGLALTLVDDGIGGRRPVDPAASPARSATASASPSAAPASPRPTATARPRASTRTGPAPYVPRPRATASDEPPLVRCHTDGLRVSLATAADDSSGTALRQVGLTNIRPRRCSVFGYPGLELRDESGAALPTAVTRDEALAPVLFVLDPGQTGWARLRWSVRPDADETAPCTPQAVSLAVTPPDESTPLTLLVPLQVCHHGEIVTTPFAP
jgi:hypothetical protein